jgi:peptide/nickel transport system permease protein
VKWQFIAIKLLRALVTLWLIVTFAFVILRLSGDPTEAILGDETDADAIAYYQKKYGLDRPLHEQYIGYFVDVLNGDLGLSFQDERDAIEVVMEAIPRTLQLGSTAFVFTLIIGIPLGIIAALHRNKAIDRFTMGFAVFGFSIPNFFLGILLILIFSLHLRILPSSGAGGLLHMIMPAFTLGTSGAGTIARFVRSSMLEVLNKSYMRTARAKGVPHARRIWWHALPNAAIPIVTIVGFQLGHLVAGSIITETVFAWPGVGRLLVNSVVSRDLAVVQTILLMVGTTMTLANLTVDIMYSWIDPRMRTSSMADKE